MVIGCLSVSESWVCNFQEINLKSDKFLRIPRRLIQHGLKLVNDQGSWSSRGAKSSRFDIHCPVFCFIRKCPLGVQQFQMPLQKQMLQRVSGTATDQQNPMLPPFPAFLSLLETLFMTWTQYPPFKDWGLDYIHYRSIRMTPRWRVPLEQDCNQLTNQTFQVGRVRRKDEQRNNENAVSSAAHWFSKIVPLFHCAVLVSGRDGEIDCVWII